jgi:hypothetical protein
MDFNLIAMPIRLAIGDFHAFHYAFQSFVVHA